MSDGVSLCNSHLLPRAGYKILRNSDGEVPFLVTPKGDVQTDLQFKAHLLCDACEQRFRARGEDWVLANCARPEGFRLNSILMDAKPLHEAERTKTYSAVAIPEIDADALAYFAASVFWRASIHHWKDRQGHIDPSSLGTKYAEQFRQYLLDEAEFPANAALSAR